MDERERLSGGTVHLDEPEFRGEMRVVTMFDEPPTQQRLRELVSGDQLVACASGAQVAMVQRFGDHEIVIHTASDARFRFELPHSRGVSSTRILRVEEDAAYVWGAALGRPPGVWYLHQSGLQSFQFELSTLCGFYGIGASRVPVGVSPLYPDHCVLCMPWGLWPLRHGAKVEIAGGCLYVLEEMDGSQFAYCADEEGVTRFTHVEDPGAMRLLPWGRSALLLSRHDGRSRLQEVGVRGRARPLRLSIDGDVVESWGSACDSPNTIATLVQPRTAVDTSVLRLYCGQQLVYEDDFTMRHSDLVWSHKGRSFAARVTVAATQRIVTPSEDRALPSGTSLREVLVTDDGNISAMILNDGVWDRMMRTGHREGTAVPMAWNLHEDEDGAVIWNTVHDDQLLVWVDRTHLPKAAADGLTTR